MKHRWVLAREPYWSSLCATSLTKSLRQIIDDLFARYQWRHHLSYIFATSSILYLCDMINHARAHATNIYDFFIPFILWLSPMLNVNFFLRNTISYLYATYAQWFFPPFIFLDFFFFPIDLSSVSLVKKFEWNVQKNFFQRWETPPIYQLSPRAVQLLIL